jgi:type II secretory pathway pseudopilin PulG
MRREQGFTIVEMLIVVIMTSVISMVIFGIGFQYLKQAAALNAQTNFYGDRLYVADYLRQNIGFSTGLINQNSLSDPNALIPDPNDATGNYWKKIHSIPGVYGTSTATTPIVYYSQDVHQSDGTTIMNGAVAYQNEFILYHHGPSQELRVRSLADPNAPGNAVKTTCTTATATCPKDKVLLTGVQTLEMLYFSRAGETIDFRSSCDPDVYYCAGTIPARCEQSSPYTGCNGLDFAQVEVVQLKIKVKKSIESDANYSMYNSTIIRIALRNA